MTAQIALHEKTFEYLRPSDTQMADMQTMREAAKQYADAVENLVPPGADKTYLLRQFREVAMWVNIAITRYQDGEPR